MNAHRASSFSKTNHTVDHCQIHVTAVDDQYPADMKKQTLVTLILTRSIPLAGGLEALLTAIPMIDEVQVARSFENACKQIVDRQPKLILIDAAALESQPEAQLAKIISLAPATQRVLLVDEVQAARIPSQYAGTILIKGLPPASVAERITNLLSAKSDKNEPAVPND